MRFKLILPCCHYFMHEFVIITRQVYFVAARVVCYSPGVTRPYCLYYVYCHPLRVTTSPEQRICDQLAASWSLGGILNCCIDEISSLCCENEILTGWSSCSCGKSVGRPLFPGRSFDASLGDFDQPVVYSFVESRVYSHLRVVRL